MENSTGSLKNKAAKGILWTAVEKYSTMAIGFVSGIVLARLLMPSDYGAIGMLSVFMALAETFIDGGFGSALIQKKAPSQLDYTTVFYFNLFVSSIAYLVLFLCAPAIARFYHLPILSSVLRVQGLVLFIHALNLIQKNQIRKNLQFKKLAIITIITSFISLIVTVYLAYKGFGVWALVVQNFIVAAIPCGYFWITTNWHPTLQFSWVSFKELFGFGSYMLLSHLFETLSSKLSSLLIGRRYNSSTMGYYSKASSTEQLASSAISGIMIQTTYPLYAQVQDDRDALINMIRRITMTLAYITVPILSLLVVVAKPVFVILYSEKWLDSVPYFQVLCFAGMASCLIAVTNQPISAIGKSRVQFYATLIKRSLAIIVTVVGMILWGIKGILFGVVFESWLSYLINTFLIQKYIGYSLYKQLVDLAPIFIASAIAAVLSLSIDYIGLPFYLNTLVKIIVFICVYVGWSLIAKPEAYRYCMSIIDSIRKKH